MFLFVDYFQTDGKETFSLEELQITLECLQHDVDKDVKYFAGGDVTDTPRCLNNAVCLIFAVPALVQCKIPLINDIANEFCAVVEHVFPNHT